MRYFLLALLFFIQGLLIGVAQTENQDTVIVDSLKLKVEQDSLIVHSDSLKNVRDTVYADSITILQNTVLDDTITIDSLKARELIALPIEIIQVPDTLHIHDIIQSSFKEIDSVQIKKEMIGYDDFIVHLKDSLIFEKPDSVYFVMHSIENIINEPSVFVNDTLVRAVKKVINHRKNLNVADAIHYLEDKINDDSIFVFTESNRNQFNDTILRSSLKYILSTFPEDSLNLIFSNLNQDSVGLAAKESEKDSVLFKIYDNRGEYGIMWIKKIDKYRFLLELEEDIFIEKAKQREGVQQKLEADMNIPNLKKVKKFNKIIPIWRFGGSADIRFNQGYISPSWAEGGESNMSMLSILKYDVNYSYGKKKSFDFDIEYRLGYLKAGDNDLQKNDDKLELNFKYGTSAFNDWYYSGLLNFKSQLLKGYEYVNDTANAISQFLSPASVVFSLGLDYKPSKKLTFLISPVTSKFTIVADTVNYDQTRFGVAKDEKVRKEIGAYIKAISKLKFRETITMENRVTFFTNYVENPQNVDVDWEIDVAFKVTDNIRMSINAHLIYDDDVAFIDDGVEKGPRIQFKELFGVGFTYKF